MVCCGCVCFPYEKKNLWKIWGSTKICIYTVYLHVYILRQLYTVKRGKKNGKGVSVTDTKKSGKKKSVYSLTSCLLKEHICASLRGKPINCGAHYSDLWPFCINHTLTLNKCYMFLWVSFISTRTSLLKSKRWFWQEGSWPLSDSADHLQLHKAVVDEMGKRWEENQQITKPKVSGKLYSTLLRFISLFQKKFSPRSNLTEKLADDHLLTSIAVG